MDKDWERYWTHVCDLMLEKYGDCYPFKWDEEWKIKDIHIPSYEEWSGMADMIATGFDDAIIGVGRRCGRPNIVAYDVEKVIQILVDRDGLSREDAEEYYEFNVVGAWVGEMTPLWVTVGEPPSEEER